MFGLSALECFIAIIVIYIVVYWITPRKMNWIPFILVTVLLSVLAYKFVPNETDDLSRYYMQLDYLREYGMNYLRRCFDLGINDWDTYRVCGYYFYFISRLPNNHWMPAITIFLCYGLAFLIFYKAANHFDVSKLYVFLGSMFFLSTYFYYDTVSGIRNGLAFAVVLACAYYHLVERKNILLCCVGYVLACLLHSAAVMPVAFVILTVITLNTSGKVMKYGLIFGITIGGFLLNYLGENSSNGFIQSIAGKAEANGLGSLYTDTNFIVNIVTFAVVSIVVLYVSFYILKGEYAQDLKRFYKYSSIIVYFMFGSILSTMIFLRFARWIAPVLGAVLFMIGMEIQNKQIKRNTPQYYYNASFPERARYQTKGVFMLFYFAYICVHFWYLVNGSSLVWIHF